MYIFKKYGLNFIVHPNSSERALFDFSEKAGTVGDLESFKKFLEDVANGLYIMADGTRMHTSGTGLVKAAKRIVIDLQNMP